MTQLRNNAATERPLTARSIVAGALLGTHPPVLRGQLLVRLGALFGVAEGTTRVGAVSDGGGRGLTAIDGRYELASPALLARQAAQERGRRTPRSRWAGEWALAIVTVERHDTPIGPRSARRRVLCASPSCGGGGVDAARQPRLGRRCFRLDVVHAQCTWMREPRGSRWPRGCAVGPRRVGHSGGARGRRSDAPILGRELTTVASMRFPRGS